MPAVLPVGRDQPEGPQDHVDGSWPHHAHEDRVVQDHVEDGGHLERDDEVKDVHANMVPEEEKVGSKVGTPSFLRRGDSKVEGE